MIKYIQHRYKNNQNYFQGIALPGPRCTLYLFSEKDTAAIANSAMRQNKVRRFRLLTPFAAAHMRLPHPGSLVARTLRCWSTRPPVLRQALVFPDSPVIVFLLGLTGLSQN